MSVPPTHIPLPPPHIPLPPPLWPDTGTPFLTPPTSPPLTIPSPSIYFTPPSSPPLQNTDDPFPSSPYPVLVLVDDEGLTPLEKIYLYARSRSVYHRVFIAHALPEYLLAVTPQEAVKYVFPLIRTLAVDDDEHVKEALAAELVPIIWWFFTDCQIIPNDLEPDEAYASSSSTVTISVQAFTPILGTLLLSPNPLIGGAARFAVVDLLSRMKKADDRQFQSSAACDGGHGRSAFPQRERHHPQSVVSTTSDIIHPWELTPAQSVDDDDDDADPLSSSSLSAIGLFGRREREMFTQEILQQVVIGMGRLDLDSESEHEEAQTQTHHQDVPVHHHHPQEQVTHLDGTTNPYFPPLPSSNSNPQSSSSLHQNGFHRRNFDQNATSVSVNPQRPTISPFESGPSTLNSSTPIYPTAGSPMAVDQDEDNWDDMNDSDEQAAVGRLSSMSLIAAVTASGVLAEAAQLAFVEEVERVGHDSVYWVRREASFALGALAKVVPQEVMLNSLLPLIFVALRQDPVWHVRHSALFALPAILSRLPPAQRRVIALETILSLSADKHPTVRSGVLEALGEAIYTFHEDSEGPPEQLIHLFLGRKEDRRVRDGQQQQHQQQEAQGQGQRTPIEEFYADPKRPLICAFNFPAVAYTLGGARWGELRNAYLDIASDTGSGVRKTLAASLGELAKIIGPANAKQDLVGVWRSSIQSDEEEVRTKAMESLHGFIEVLGKEVGKPLVRTVLTEWNEGRLRGWRERELVERKLVGWINLIGPDNVSLARAILRKGLEDNVAIVREAATGALPEIWDLFSAQEDGSSAVDSLRSVLEQLATSSNYRRRMTFIACQQTLALSTNNTNKEGQLLIEQDENILRSVADLANDGIEGVRIGVARFAATVHNMLVRRSQAIPNILGYLVQQLLQDSSHEVRSYVARLSLVDADDHHQSSSSLSNGRTGRKRLAQLATFSRPPTSPTPTGSLLPHQPPAGGTFLRMMDSNVSVSGDHERDDDGLGNLTRPGGNNGTPCESDVGPITTSTGGLRGVYPITTTTAAMAELGSAYGSSATERVTVPA